MKKIIDFNQLNKISTKIKKEKKKIALCHGVFDLLHVGHIKHFEAAKKISDCLIVSITSDQFVNKGIGRPAFKENLRAEVISALECVDYVVISNFASSIPVINEIKPSFYCKGNEYRNEKDDVTGKIKHETLAVKKNGGKIFFTDEITFSSSNLINNHFKNTSESQKKLISDINKKISFKNILKKINELKKIKVLIIGEFIVDEYNFCEALGKSGKEPVLAMKAIFKETYLGGSLAIARHLSSFVDSQINLLGALGEKCEMKRKILHDLPKNINLNYIKKTNSPTIIKRRFLDHLTKNKILGVYSINDDVLNKKNEKEFHSKLKKLIKKSDLVIVSDYGHGLISKESASLICKKSNFLAVNAQLNASNIGFHTLRNYKNVNVVIINEGELRHELRDRNSPVKGLMKNFSNSQNIKYLIVTKGTEGSILYDKKNNIYFESIAYAQKAVDKIGAGDAMLALLSAFIYKNFPKEFSLLVGSLAGAYSVQSLGNKESIKKIDIIKHIEHLLK